MFICVCLSVCVYVCSSVCLSVFMCLSVSVCLSVFMCVALSICVCVFICVCLSVAINRSRNHEKFRSTKEVSVRCSRPSQGRELTEHPLLLHRFSYCKGFVGKAKECSWQHKVSMSRDILTYLITTIVLLQASSEAFLSFFFFFLFYKVARAPFTYQC